ncbi:MAG: PIN domain-containing protein [Candidatus Saccharibacteria bacterium]
MIYALEGTSTWSNVAQAIVKQGESEGAVLSVLAWQELMTGAALKGNNVDKKLDAILRDLGTTRFVPVTLAICERAVALTKRYGKQVYGYDAIHLATALEYKADTFITNDKALIGLQLDALTIRSL